MTEDEFHQRTGGFFKSGLPLRYLEENNGFYEIDIDQPAICTMERANALIDHMILFGLADHKQGWRPGVLEALSNLAHG